MKLEASGDVMVESNVWFKHYVQNWGHRNVWSYKTPKCQVWRPLKMKQNKVVKRVYKYRVARNVGIIPGRVGGK